MSQAEPKTLFISDLHLARSRPDISEQFSAFLAGPAREARALYILGDLFEAWIGDDAIGPFEIDVAESLRALSDQGTSIEYLHGNRDFLLGREFARMAGIKLLAQPHFVDLYGTPTVLLHGDQLCTLDRQYQQLRKRVTDPAWQQRMLSRPLWFRKTVARFLRGASRLRNRNANAVEMDVVADDAERVFREYGAVRMIHGHTHRPGRHIHMVDETRCERIVLGDWYTQGSVLIVEPDSVALESLERDLSGDYSEA